MLDADPELGYQLTAEDLTSARRYAVAELMALEPGEWPDAGELSEDAEGHLGLLVVGGLLARQVQLANTSCAELLGQGDVLRPWDEDCGYSIAHYDVSWRVLEPTRLAVLDRRFATVACRWPALIDVVLRRTVFRSRCLAFHLAVTHLTRVDMRVLVTLWFLAERWGRVRPEGVVLPLRLTHQLIARLVGAQRPSVTTALGELSANELVERRSDGSWLLRGGPPEDLRHVRPPAVEDEDSE